MHVIEEAGAVRGHKLRLRFADGRAGAVDISELIARGGVFARQQDAEAFSRVRVAGGDRWVEWLGDIDLCADALYEKVQGLSAEAPRLEASDL